MTLILRNVTITIAEIEIVDAPLNGASIVVKVDLRPIPVEKAAKTATEIAKAETPVQAVPGEAEQARPSVTGPGSSASTIQKSCGSRDEPAGKSSAVNFDPKSITTTGEGAPSSLVGDDGMERPLLQESPAANPRCPSRVATTVIGTAGNQPGPHDTLPTTVAALMAAVGDQVRAAVANPPAPEVEMAAELDLRRPVGDGLDLPAFLDRRPARTAA